MSLLRRSVTASVLVWGVILMAPSWSSAQVEPPDSASLAIADSVRASLTRPPGRHPFDGYDVLALPFRAASLPLEVLGEGIAWVAGLVTQPRPPPFYLVAFRDVSEWGLDASVGSVGKRGGPGVSLLLHRFRPLYLETAVSIRENQRHRAGLSFVGARGELDLSYTFLRHAGAHFWGIGPGSREGDRSDYLWDRQSAVLRALARPLPAIEVQAVGAFENNRVGRGFDEDRPDIRSVFSADSVFGIRERTEYYRFSVRATLDLSRWHWLQMRGLWLSLGSSVFLGTDGTDSDFHRIEGELHGYLPINERQQLALRGLFEINRGDSGFGVPFTHLAAVGSTHGQRGYSTDRFRDRDAVALMSEWRYEIWRELQERVRAESFVFADLSGVENSLSRLDSSDMRWGYGLGMRLVLPERVAFVWYLGLSEETTRLRAKFDWAY